jgi:nitroimidazol reductase NimA-like FMN-containing flavoprotein (pyridoxamine 5'-phosphate oxidase superfamily)
MFFSTLDARGRAKGVPVWFNFHDGVMHLVSMKDSVKAAKIRRNPRVRLRVLEGGEGGENNTHLRIGKTASKGRPSG